MPERTSREFPAAGRRARRAGILLPGVPETSSDPASASRPRTRRLFVDVPSRLVEHRPLGMVEALVVGFRRGALVREQRFLAPHLLGERLVPLAVAAGVRVVPEPVVAV